MEIGRKLEGIIASLGVFEDINVTKITVPLSGTGSGGRLPLHPFLIWGR
jgi:hypothetical protein